MKKYSGFTIIELMIVIGIVAVLMSLAAPSFSNFVKNDRLTTQINTLVGHLAYARSEAILRAQPVGLCASSNGTACLGAWSEGWLLYVDADNSGSYNATTDTILRVNQALSGNNKLTTTLGTNFLYDNRGYAATGTGSFSLCDDRGVSYAKMIVISNTGRVRGHIGAESPTC